MALTTLIYVGGIPSLREARYCAGMGVELLGFALDANAPGHVSAAAFADITGWLSGVRTVGEVGALTAAEVTALRPVYPTDYLLTDDPSQVVALSSLDCPLLLRVPLAEDDVASLRTICEAHHTSVAYFVVTLASPLLTEIELAFLRRLARKYPLLLELGPGAAHLLPGLLAEVPARGASVSLRSTPFDDLATLLEALEEVD